MLYFCKWQDPKDVNKQIFKMAKRYEQKGSLSLRSDHMDYGRATLVSNWHQAREAEPKDHDIHKIGQYDAKNRNLHQSTYNRILNVTDGTFPVSTSHDHMNQIKLRKDFEEKVSRHAMIDHSTFHHTTKHRNTGTPERGFGSILPRHPTNHNTRYLDTTYEVDYRNTYPYEPSPVIVNDDKDESAAYRKCHSQFTDVADYRRHGRNTWHNESGTYANSETKKEVFKTTNPIPERLL
ncbi:cilia- and flagella-associated protein 95-like isoform X1 [Hydractinia symbiolongicarpus]|uniref:cilia- and flagella-associated protein 95-like isoform X1 n=1 Tax=Hydractinia symbiolongicarpus TaxID=13093 RepID=UPI00254DBF93|nr:cilia- and flagella-associated protein 95-like isoform X1 [Hydractinia symbiolongicarpus]